MVRVFYPQMFHKDPTRLKQAKSLSERVFEFSEFLVKILGVTNIGSTFQGKIAYHPSCHLLRELEVTKEPLTLLQHVQGAEVVPIKDAETCCGFGGTFSVKYPEISEEMLDNKVRNVTETGAQLLIACDTSCIMHISGAISRRNIDIESIHLAQLLARND